MVNLYDDFIDTLHSTLMQPLAAFCAALGFNRKEGKEITNGIVEVETNINDRRMFATMLDKETGRLIVTDAECNILDVIDFRLNNNGEWYER